MTTPLSLGEFARHPCGLITENRRGRLKVNLPGQQDSVEDERPVCRWYADDPDAPALEVIPYADRSILREVYATTPDDVFVFAPREVRGMPAVIVVENRETRVCTNTIGISDHQGVQIRDYGVGQGGFPNNCGLVEVAEDIVMATLGAKAR